MDIKLIALDVDGTLLNTKMEITPATVEALEKAHRAGIHIVISTGRLVSECQGILRALPFVRYMNTCTGSEVVDLSDGRSIAGRRIPGDEARRLYEKLKDLDMMICSFDPTDGHPHCRKEQLEYCRTTCSPEVVEHLQSLYRPEDDFDGYFETIGCSMKFYIPCFTPESKAEGLRRLAEEPYSVLEVGERDIEIMPIGVDKAEGLRLLTEALGMTAQQVMAIGDSGNDVSMLQYAGLAVCMANGTQDARAVADHITDDNDHDGVAKAVNMVLEGKL